MKLPNNAIIKFRLLKGTSEVLKDEAGLLKKASRWKNSQKNLKGPTNM